MASAFFRNARRVLAALFAAIALAAPAAAEPALWVVKDRDSTIYLFGTAHVLKPGTQWLSPKLEAAIAKSGQLWLEVAATSRDDLRAAMAPLVRSYGIAGNASLASRLTAAEQKQLEAATQRTGLPPHAFDIFRPWFAALSIATSALTRAGYDQEAGVEARLQKMFAKRGIAPNAFETPEDQVRIFADMSDEGQLRYLRAALTAHERAPQDSDRFVELWMQGDTDTMEVGLVGGMKHADPALYERLIARRNTAWAERIEEMLKDKGTVFIAVGIAHLLGPDSVQAQLRRREIRAVSAP